MKKKEAKPKEKATGSVNKFLGGSDPILPPPPPPKPKPAETALDLPAWLFHETMGKRLFTDQAQYEKALREGWVDTPAKFK